MVACGDSGSGGSGSKSSDKTEAGSGKKDKGSDSKEKKHVERGKGMTSEERKIIEGINEDTAEKQGVCGADAMWYYKDNVLVIRGEGAVTQSPWLDEDEGIRKSIVWMAFDEGITEINYESYFGYTVEKVFLPSTLQIIGNTSFCNCHRLSEINIPDSVTYIGRSAFLGTKLTEVYIPANVNVIDETAFKGCDYLTTVEIAGGVIEKGAFEDCDFLETVILDEGVTEIHGGFEECYALKEVYIPASVEYISPTAFPYTYDSNIDEILAENKADRDSKKDRDEDEKARDEKARDDDDDDDDDKSRTEEKIDVSTLPTRAHFLIKVDENNKVYESYDGGNTLVNKETKTLVRGNKDTKIPERVEVIGENAFGWEDSAKYNYMESIVIPSNVKRIDSEAFEGCRYLENVAIENEEIEIEDDAFRGCGWLSEDSYQFIKSVNADAIDREGDRKYTVEDGVKYYQGRDKKSDKSDESDAEREAEDEDY